MLLISFLPPETRLTPWIRLPSASMLPCQA